MSAITAALSQIDGVAAEGDLVPEPTAALELATPGEPILLPDGKRIYPPCLHGAPVDELALALLDMDDPAKSTFLRLIGPPGAGKSQIARAIAYRLWTGRGREVARPARRPVLRVRRAAAGPVVGRVLLPLRLRPGRRERRPSRARRLGVRAGDARGVGGDDRRGQHRPRRRAAVDQRHPRRTAQPLPGGDRRDRRRQARVRRPARLQPGARRRDRHPRRLALAVPGDARGHEQLGGACAARRAGSRSSTEAMRLDRQRIAGEDGLCWTPQFRDIESLWRMSERVGERAALAFFASNLHEQVTGGEDPGRRGGRRLPDARPGRLRPAARVCQQRHAEPARLPAGGDLMSPATRAAGRPAVFVQQLHRAAAQRGRLDPVYQDLSDHWTAILQRLYPVWALIGPGLSDPGHIEIHSRTVYLDSEALLGSRADDRRAGRSSGGRSCAASGWHCTRRCTPSTPSAGRSSTTSRCPSRTTRPTGSSRSTGGCSRSRGWRPTACASSRPTRCAAGSSAARCRPR